MRFLFIFLIMIVVTPAMADDGRAEFMSLCQNKFKKNEVQCSCSLDNFFNKDQKQNPSYISLEGEKQKEKEQMEADIAHYHQKLLDDPQVNEGRIAEICAKHDELAAFLSTFSHTTTNHGDERIDTTKLSSAERQQITIARRDTRKDAHETLHRWNVNTQSYGILVVDRYCRQKRLLPKLDEKYAAKKQKIDAMIEKAKPKDLGTPSEQLEAHKGDKHFYRDIVVNGMRNGCHTL